MESRKLNVGVIGVNIHRGWGGNVHLPALLKLPEYQVIGVCTTREESSKESAKHFDVPMAFSNYEDLVHHPDIDVVSVCVSVPLHHQMVLTAIKAGKHVYCEWPLAVTVSEAEEMAAAASQTSMTHMVGLQLRCSPVLLYLKELVKEGYIGKVLSCNMNASVSNTTYIEPRLAWEVDKEKGAHVLSIPAGHTLDVISYCISDFVEINGQVTTQLTKRTVAGTTTELTVTSPDHVSVTGTLANGAVVSAHIARAIWHGTGWSLEVYGTEGTLVASSESLPQLSPIIHLNGARHDEKTLHAIDTPNRLRWAPLELDGVEPLATAQMYRSLANAIKSGEATHPNFDDALHHHRLLAAIETSSNSGKRISLI